MFPFYDATQCTTTNIDYWNLQSRPGYWFGLGSSILEQPALSSLQTPTFSTSGGKTVATVKTNNWVWSNANTGGQTQVQDAGSILFWLNMDKAQEDQGASAACGFVPNLGIPDQVSSVTAPNGLTGNEVVITFDTTLNTKWLLNNELSQIDPMPEAWDITNGSNANLGACEAESWSSIKTDGSDDCSAVFNYLSGLQINNPIWDWADGPYRQQSAGYASGQPDGDNVQIANTRYSGPSFDQPHAVKTIQYYAYTTVAAEQSDLKSGLLDSGYLDPSDVGKSPGPGKAGAIKSSLGIHGYKTIGTLLWGVFYWMYNFGDQYSTYPSTAVWAQELNQQYIRGAMQESVDQAAIDTSVNNGYSVPTISAIPTYPKNTYGTGIKNAYPYSTSKAKASLIAHGWTITTGSHGTTTCTRPGTASNECGANIPRGSQLNFVVLSPSGDPAVNQQVDDEIATMKDAGFHVSAKFELATTVQAACFGGASEWQICAYGGWIYAPDYYPSGEVLFARGSSSNSGGYNSPTMQRLVQDTTAGNTALNAVDHNVTPATSFAQWANTDDPFLWQPTPAGFTVVKTTLTGPSADIAPNPLGDFMPEFFTAI